MRRCRGQELGQGIVRCLAIGVHLVPMRGVFSVQGPSSVLPQAGAANRCDFGGSSHVTKKGLDAPGSGSPVKGGAMTLAPGASRPWAFRRSGHRNAAQGRLRTGQGADEATDRARDGGQSLG